mmetsp:Transcript_13447/g.42956  ORF Transcript_13447/g.42956 Transcript_13447/m.42956 type:complete len:352 (-) Transcript_13447:1003-2058(-)
MRIICCDDSTSRSVRAISASMTGPRSSLSKCTSSMTSKPTDWTIPSEPLRVVTSHFSGVVTMSCVCEICSFVSCWSPVSSLTVMPNGSSRFPKLSTISCTSAFIGATYTILKASRSNEPSGWRCSPISCSSVSIATLVLPAPVGAQSSMFSAEKSAQSYTRDCTRLSDDIPPKAGRAQAGMSSIRTSASPSVKGFALSAGTCTSSYPFLATRNEPGGRWHLRLAIRWPPAAKVIASRSSVFRPTRALPASGTAASMSAVRTDASASALRMRARSAVSLRTRASSCFVSVKISSVLSRAAARSESTSAACGDSPNSRSSACLAASDCACASRVQTAMRQRCLSNRRMSSNLS